MTYSLPEVTKHDYVNISFVLEKKDTIVIPIALVKVNEA